MVDNPSLFSMETLTPRQLPKNRNKIMVFGLPGSGKSTFAIQLAQYLDLPIYHLDKHFYIENWVERDYQEFLDIQQSFVNQSKWVIDGNAMKSLEMRFQKADVAVYFHYSVFLCLWRILKRVFHKNWHISDLAEGCTKSVRFRLIKYMFRFHRRYSSKIKELCDKYPHVDFYVFTSDVEATRFLNSIKGGNAMDTRDVSVKKSGIGQFEEGLGVFANREFKKGEVVLKWNLKAISEDEYSGLPEYEKNNFCHKRDGIQYYYPVPERYVNRSKHPNVYPDFEKEADVALRDIKKGEELSIPDTFVEDY